MMTKSRFLHRLARVSSCVLGISLSITPGLAAGDSEEAWAALVKGGHVALIRHGNAPPGFGGDPPGFRLDDCNTQRNLDDKGRAQSKGLGEAYRGHGVHVDRILSSPVCRCMDTASLMAAGQVENKAEAVKEYNALAKQQNAQREKIKSLVDQYNVKVAKLSELQ